MAANWRTVLLVLIGFTFVHIAAACARGGKLRYFVWPFNLIWLIRRLARGGYYTEARDAVWDMVVALRLPYYFWLGFRGFVGAFAWLALPITLLAVGSGHFAAARPGRRSSGRCCWRSFCSTCRSCKCGWRPRTGCGPSSNCGRCAPTSAAPLCLRFCLRDNAAVRLAALPVEDPDCPPRRRLAAEPGVHRLYLPGPPADRVGLARAARRPAPRHWFFRWTARLPLLPAALFYVLIVFFTQYTSWNGVWSLYEQHAFLVPVPFFGM